MFYVDRKKWERFWLIGQPIVAVFIGLFLGVVLIGVLEGGKLELEDGATRLGTIVSQTFAAVGYLWDGSVGSLPHFAMTVFYTVPLIFTGLAVALAFHGGLFNIGAQGQLLVGCLAGTVFALLFPGLPPVLAPLLAIVVAMVFGALWAGFAGYLKARVGAHEVITTIMLNYIAASFVQWITLNVIKNPDTPNPESKLVAASYMLPTLSLADGEANFSFAVVIAVLAVIAVWVFLYKTVWGFELRAVGQNEHAARGAGVQPARVRVWAMGLAGAMASFVFVSEILGNAHRFKVGISDYGFTGIAVALLGRCHPIGVAAAALLFGALQQGSMHLEMEMNYITSEITVLLRAIVILVVSADGAWYWFKRRGEKALRVK